MLPLAPAIMMPVDLKSASGLDRVIVTERVE